MAVGKTGLTPGDLYNPDRLAEYFTRGLFAEHADANALTLSRVDLFELLETIIAMSLEWGETRYVDRIHRIINGSRGHS
jgi:hypothetical protein